jgi:hypothetical protein
VSSPASSPVGPLAAFAPVPDSSSSAAAGDSSSTLGTGSTGTVPVFPDEHEAAEIARGARTAAAVRCHEIGPGMGMAIGQYRWRSMSRQRASRDGGTRVAEESS